MTFLERATEADEDAELSDAAIDDGLRTIRTLWTTGLACHRDIKQRTCSCAATTYS